MLAQVHVACAQAVFDVPPLQVLSVWQRAKECSKRRRLLVFVSSEVAWNEARLIFGRTP